MISKHVTGDVPLCNTYTVALAEELPEVRHGLDGAALNLPDGMPLVWLARSKGVALDDRAYGPNLMSDALDRGRELGLRHHLYDGRPEGLARLRATIEHRSPGGHTFDRAGGL